MKQILLASALLFSSLLTHAADAVAPTSNTAVASSVREKIQTESRRILKVAKSSDYSHTTKVNEEEGSYDVDCSGLVNLILKNISKEHYEAVQKSGGRPRPRALEYYATFLAAPKGWENVARVSDAQPGDLLVWRRAEITPGEDTGHIVILDETPKREDDGQYKVTVIDSTKSAHADDTRKKDDTGIGRGTLWVAVDADGKPTGYRWKSRKGELHSGMLLIGRAAD